jgi:hypothetical protein
MRPRYAIRMAPGLVMERDGIVGIYDVGVTDPWRQA